MGDFLFGSSPEPAQPFRAPGFQQHGELLNQLITGRVLAANPALAGATNAEIASLEAQLASLPPPGTGGAARGFGTIAGGAGDPFAQQRADLTNRLNQLQAQQAGISQFRQNIPTFEPLQPLQFQQRTPFEFTPAADIFTPQIEAAEAVLQRQGTQQRQDIQEDLNRRGLLTTGVTTGALGEQRAREQETLGTLGAQLAAQQAGMEFQREQAQAQELFRQAGASDIQAQQMAQDALARRGAQLQQEQFLNVLQRQPLEDLLRLFSFSTGGTPATPGSPGLLQQVAGPAAQAGIMAAAGAFCLPKGTEIETEKGTIKVEEAEIGQKVKGGVITGWVQKPRPLGHKFFKHEFSGDRFVVMSAGHPHIDKLVDIIEDKNDSEHTYDILTTDGYYFVNGVKLGSTLGG